MRALIIHKFVLLLILSTPLCFSSQSLAQTLKEKMIIDLSIGTDSPWTILELLANNTTLDIPARSLREHDYQRVLTEFLKLHNEYYSSDKKQLSKEYDGELEYRLNIMFIRVRMLSDPLISGYCSDIPLDLDTAKNSLGDWKIVKDKYGRSIKPSSNHHWNLFRYYSSGCTGKKDFAIARKVLFDISDLSLDVSNSKSQSELRAEIRHCEAELWARHGIGGPTSEVKAQEFSRRFTKNAWFQNTEDTPEERQKILKRPEYQHAIKNNFGCPKRTNIDPRNPWEDL
ncbi:hypothetical protein [Sedimenticola selenatireducens]|uniref:Uncharacterized protein n=1 Tax=Sedimenticola selenatireducens TaxID=191960 RepID=A0A558DVU4_9GAMM|nr:hypothetical protein [Sedimenticola selenatireducens]TVO77851.1 hypothetical protein FHP88_03365 [Sedimenticola selenatireducens]TVT65156.1 MAG: hypothetical protein FHK78_05730 [Sedimenticola selenatireducens]